MSNKMEILEGLHYGILEKWIANGKVDTLPEGMEEYMNHLTAVLGFHNRSFSKSQIIKRLQASFNLSYSQAKTRFVDALNYFYLDQDIKHEAFMSIVADKLISIGNTIIQSAKSPEELILAVKPFKEAALIREKIKPTESIPEELFQRPNKLYTINLPDLGEHDPINRNLLAKMIDEMSELDEAEKLRIKQDASIEPKKLFDFNDE